MLSLAVMGLAVESNNGHGVEESKYQRGVRHLCEGGIERVPRKYVFPVSERPDLDTERSNVCYGSSQTLKLPVIDFARLQGSNRSQVLKCLANACEEYGFFQVIYMSSTALNSRDVRIIDAQIETPQGSTHTYIHMCITM